MDDEEAVGSLSVYEIELFDHVEVILPLAGMDHEERSSTDLSAFSG